MPPRINNLLPLPCAYDKEWSMWAFNLWRNLILVVIAIGILSGCAGDPKNIDPWETVNRPMYDFNEGLDRYALKPLADGYVKVVPKPVRTGLGNAFDNLGYGNVILNDFLQAKWGQGCSDAGRMAVNSTVGIGGIFDVAGPWRMPSHDNDFGITLGKWGAPAGIYVVLPLFGPSCGRDAPGIGVEIVTDPVTWVGAPLAATISLGATQAVDARSRADMEVRFRDAAAIDPYVFTRSAYLQYREGQIHEGQAPAGNSGMYDEEPGAASAPATRGGPSTMPAPGTP
jgi:phospholipid-binding lipoprotein MlaA